MTRDTASMHNKQLEHRHFQRQSKKYPLCILANDIELAANVGSLFRIADALGVEKIFLCGHSPVPPNSKINKTARSTEKTVPYEYAGNALDIIRRLKAENYQIVSLEITSASMDIRDYVVSGEEKICLIVGAENTGINQALLDASDCTIHIPMLGHNSSMNVATACAIAVFEIVRKYLPATETVHHSTTTG